MDIRLYGITFILAGIIMLVITVVQLFKYLSFKNCDVTTATVVGVDMSSHYSENHRRVSYCLELSYTVDSVDYRRKTACDSQEYKLGTGRQVEILYKSHNPKRIMLNNPDKQNRGQRILWIITLALLVMGVVMMLLG